MTLSGLTPPQGLKPLTTHQSVQTDEDSRLRGKISSGKSCCLHIDTLWPRWLTICMFETTALSISRWLPKMVPLSNFESYLNLKEVFLFILWAPILYCDPYIVENQLLRITTSLWSRIHDNCISSEKSKEPCCIQHSSGTRISWLYSTVTVCIIDSFDTGHSVLSYLVVTELIHFSTFLSVPAGGVRVHLCSCS